nr:hypothetical protein [Escherichia coli]
MTSLKTSIKTITYLSDIGCLEIQGASLIDNSEPVKCKRRTTLGKSLLFSRVLYREWWPATYCSRVSGYPHRLPVQI